MFIRPAQPEDLAALKSFDEWDTVTGARLRAGECHVAGLNGDPLAFGILDRSFFSRRFVAILFVHPEHRRHGLGTRLLGHFESICGDDALWISTNVENRPMQCMLHKHGFELTGVVNNLGRVPELVYYKTFDRHH